MIKIFCEACKSVDIDAKKAEGVPCGIEFICNKCNELIAMWFGSALDLDEGLWWHNPKNQPERLSEKTSKDDATV